ncbi:MAG: N-acetylglucosamine-6-phosphate deacetylase [Clostridiales bacterium]|nr:N-acetylglucosamine-6-phosphate deacetylase [Clostridiales bacterium]
MKRIKNGVIFQDGKWLNDHDLLLDGGSIVGIVGNDEDIDATIIDAAGNYVVPGFINIHIHGAEGKDVMDGTEKTIRELAKFSARYGSTSFLPTTVTSSVDDTRKCLKAIKAVMESDYEGANILGVHLEGPFIDYEYKGAQVGSFIRDPSIDNYLEMTEGFEDIIKLITLAPEKDGAKELIQYLKSKDVTVSMGHTGANYDECMEAFNWGVSHVTHCYNAITPLHHRNPGAIGAAFDSESVTIELIADLIHIHPAMLRLAVKVKGSERTALVTDSMAATNLSDGEYELGDNKVWVKDGIARIEAGNLAGSTLTQDAALRNIVDNGISLEDAILMLTATPASIIGVEDFKGYIKVGYDADIVVLDKNLDIDKVFVRGEAI